MRIKFIFFSLIGFLFFLFCPTRDFSRQQVSTHLFRIAKPLHSPVGVIASSGGVIRQELQNNWIVMAPSAAAAKLSRCDFRLTLLDEHAEQKEYYLVRFTPPPNGIPQNLQLIPVEDGVFLYSGDMRALEVALPIPISCKRLPQSVYPAQSREEAISPFRSQAFSPEIPEMVTQVSKTSLTSIIHALENFQTRRAETPQCQAAGDYIAAYLSRLGIAIETESFTFYDNNSSRNIIGTIRGQTSPQNVVILCAHYDSTSNQPTTLAPGADDNASGTAAVMEAARILSRYPFDHTLVFALFSAEELGLFGSQYYAIKATENHEKILAVINLDMIAYTDFVPEDLDIIVNPASEWLADTFIYATQQYTPMEIKKIVNASFVWSDHASFWDRGYSALCGIEDANPPNPHYHTTHDTLDTLNLDFAYAVTQAALATSAEIARPVRHPLPPAGITCRSQISASLFSASKTAYLDWQPSPDSVIGYHIYRSTDLSQGLSRLTSTPLTERNYRDRFLNPKTTFYYAVTAIDSQNRESNYSQIVKDNENN